jgi:K+-transporting ATPase KdpF subunit
VSAAEVMSMTGQNEAMIVICIFLLLYLTYALLRPEQF